MKKFFKIVVSLFVIFVLFAVGGIFFLSRGLKEGSSIEITGINSALLADGAYTGEYKSGRWSNEVSVTIRDNKIIDIKILDDVMIPKPEVTEEIIKRVINSQSTQVDVVSSATVTSNAYLKSIEDALKK